MVTLQDLFYSAEFHTKIILVEAVWLVEAVILMLTIDNIALYKGVIRWGKTNILVL